MTERMKRAGRLLAQKRIRKADLIFGILALFCLSYMLRNDYRYDHQATRQVAVESPWLAKVDGQGNYYVIDQEKTRILKITDGQVGQTVNGAAPDGDTFYYAENLCIGGDGSLFIHDTGWSETGFSLEYERIVQYDAKGRLLGSCYRVDYGDSYVDKHRLFGMTASFGRLYFVAADESGFELHEYDPASRERKVVSVYEMPDAITLVQDFVIDTKGPDIYAVDKRGRIYRASGADKTVTELYRLENDRTVREGQKVVMYRAAMGVDQTIYVTDIGSEQLLRFTEASGYQREAVLTGSQMWNVSCQELADGRVVLSYVADGGICTADADGSGLTWTRQYPKSVKYGLRELFFDLTALVGMLASGYLLLRLLVVILTIPYSNTQKVGVLVISTVLAVSVILVYGLMGQFKTIYRDELLIKLSMTAQIVSSRIDGACLDEIEQPQNYMNQSYRKLWNEMDMVVDKDYAYSEDIYCNILRYDGTLGYALVYLDNSIGTYYPLTADETAGVRTVYEQGIPVQSDVSNETGSYIYVLTPVIGADNQVAGVVSVGTLSSVIDGKIQKMSENIVIAMIMIILVIMFLFGEVLSFFELRDRCRRGEAHGQTPVPMHIVRLTVFITFMAFNMATSFLPVYVMRFVREGMGIPVALANSLPITVNLIFIGITSLFCPKLVGRLGFARLAAISSGIALSGDILMACCSSYGMVVAGLMLNGIGVGLITNSIHIFIASVTREQGNEEGFSIFNAASLSGINCGMLFGSALAERLDQNRVFFVSALVWGLVTVVFLVLGGRFVMARNRPEQEGRKRKGMAEFVTSWKVLKFMLCIQVPYIIINSFTYYYVPVYGYDNHLSEKVTSLLIIACSLCSVYLSVSVTGYLSRRFKDKAMYLSSLITFAGLLLFAWKMTLPALLAALLLIGLAGSFGSSTRIAYYLGLKEAIEYGEENAMGAYNFVDNLGASTGSIIFAGIISIGFSTGILGLIGAVGSLNGFYALTERRREEEADEIRIPK